MRTGKYIVIDGGDGTGKGTVIEFLKIHLGNKVFFTREPGGTQLGEKIRTLLFSDYMNLEAEFYLFLAQRAQHKIEFIVPKLSSGCHIISDRAESSTFAYQICARDSGRSLEAQFWYARENQLPHPDLYIILDASTEIAMLRSNERRKSGGEVNRFDEEREIFHKKVRDGFLEFTRTITQESCVVNAERTQEEVCLEVLKIVNDYCVKQD